MSDDADAPRERPEPPPPPPRSERDEVPDRIAETIRQKLEQLVPDLVKKTFAAGMGAVFTTEEGIRRVVGGARDSLPEVAGYLASSADGAKDKVFEIVARETREFLSNLNLTEEIAKILTTLSFEIKTEIRFIPNSERVMGAEPDVKASVRLKKNDAQVGVGQEKKDDDVAGRESRSRLRFWRRDEGGPPESDEDDSPEK
ncbi:MAG: hypothetical protein M4D80_07810 [Myxococcota bacterium]|nr:hypothetical protein [Myxococcota bacterium]